MSLLHWWPLIEDGRDNLSSTSPILSGSSVACQNSTYYVSNSYVNGGKIGSTCVQTDGSYIGGIAEITPVSSNLFSISFWINIRSFAAWGTYIALFDNENNYWSICSHSNLKDIGTQICFDGRYAHDNAAQTDGYEYENAPGNTWIHMAFVRTKNNLKWYVNGNLIADRADYEPHAGRGDVTSFTYLSIGSRGPKGSLQRGAAKFNDIRIYNHALSVKEVKEIAKGLCLHYTFNHEDLDFGSSDSLYGYETLYEPVEYIRSTGGSLYIDLPNFPYGGHMVMETKVSIYEDTGTDQDILADLADIQLSLANFRVNGRSIQGKYINWLEPQSTDFLQIGSPYVIKSDFKDHEQRMWYNGNPIMWDNYQYYCEYGTMYVFGNATGGLGSGTTTMRIFRSRAGDGNYPMHGNLYYLKYWKDDILIYDFIPCVRKSDLKPGLLNLVDNTFYTNSSNDVFEYPGNIENENTEIEPFVNRILDSSGYGHNATLGPACKLTTSDNAIIGNMSLDTTYNNPNNASSSDPNTTTYIDTNLNPSFLAGNGTICFWYKKDLSALSLNNGGFLVAVSDITTNSSTGGWLFATDAGNNFNGNGFNSGASFSQAYIDGKICNSSNPSNIEDTGWHFYVITGVNLSSWSNFILNGHNTAWRYRGLIGDFRIYATNLSEDDILDLYKTRAIVDKKRGVLYANNFVEDSVSSVYKTGKVEAENFIEILTLEDGSTWAPICVHHVPEGVFTSADTAYNYESSNRWTNFGLINTAARPEDNYYEFLVMNQFDATSDRFTKYRFKQNINPFEAAWSDVNTNKIGINVIKISSNCNMSAIFGGMYWLNDECCSMCFANNYEDNWFGCGIKQYWYDSCIPSYDYDPCYGWQLVYMRIANINEIKIYNPNTVNLTELKED